jgi:hypothetical protein
VAKKLTPRGIRLHRVRLLGFLPEAAAAGLRPALDAVAGPRVELHHGPGLVAPGLVAPGLVAPGLVALAQPEPPTPLLRGTRADMLSRLHTVQRRLEIACQAGAFLPMDPAAACCPPGEVAAMLAQAWPALAAALAGHGRRQQWDIVLRWTPEAALAPRRAEIAAAAGADRALLAEAVAAALRETRALREAALIAALRPAVLAFAAAGAAGAETEVALTVLLPADGEAAVEAALGGLAPEHAAGATLDMRGPLPPLSFGPVRVAKVDAAALAAAWERLDLPARIDRDGLHRQWRRRAFALHPDRNAAGGSATTLPETTTAYHLLRDLMRDAATAEITLAELSRHAGYRLIVPPPDEDTDEQDGIGVPPSALATAEPRVLP